MQAVGHYEELGVAPSASAEEIRTAYLGLARRYHPDRFMSAPPADQDRANRRMARINAAWAVLSDAGRRAAYDSSTRPASVPPRGVHVADPDASWEPYERWGEVDPRLLDDTPTGAPTLHRSWAFIPAGLFTAGAVAFGLGLFMALRPLVGVGIGLVVLSALSFVLVPVLAMVNSSRSDPDR